MFTILIIEDEPEIRLELKCLLENAFYQVKIIEHFETLLQTVETIECDLILLDITLPNLNGISFCRELRRKREVPIIFVTSRDTSMDELECLTAGGDDYIKKPYHASVLLAHIAAVLRRTNLWQKEESYLLEWKNVKLNLANSTIAFSEKEIALTKNEQRICYLLFSHAGTILTREDIIDDLWENQIFIDDNTLSVNITRIRNKLKEIGVEDFITTKRGQGYLI